jgi:hypothetical protein
MMFGRTGIVRPFGRSMVVLGIALLVACSKAENAAPAPPSTTATPAGDVQAGPTRTLAYEHAVSVELRKQDLSPRTREIQSACASAAELGCTLLDISLNEQASVPSAHISLRLAPGQVDRMVEIAARGGRVLSRRTHGEDLAQPIADTDRQIALLSMHRDRLSEFLRHPDLKIEQVIDLSKEISATQAAIENFTATKANLRRRVDTERLDLDLYPPEGAYAAVRTPVANALRSFADDFSTTLAVVIRFIAVILPLLLLAGVGGGAWWLVRRTRKP